MKFAICQELFEEWDWTRQCEFIARTGYTGIELAPFTIAEGADNVSDDTLREMRETATSNGLEIIGLHWLLAKTEGLHLTSDDAAVRQRTAEYLRRLGHICAELGGNVMVFGSPPQRNLQPGISTEQAMENAADVFRQCVPQNFERGVRLCMEPLTSKETDFVNTCAQAVELINLVDHPGICLHQDVKAMLGAESDSIPELIHRHKDICGHFHVNDSNLLGPGMGETDYRPILKALLDSGYEKWVSVEVFDYSPGAEHIARESLRYLKETLDQVS